MTRLSAALQLSPHLFVAYAEFPHHDSANVYLVTGERPLLIDCGSAHAAQLLLRNLERIGTPIGTIERAVATHGHCDHVQGFDALRAAHPGLRLLIHALDIPLVQQPGLAGSACHLYNGVFRPVPAASIVALGEGDRIPAGDGELLVLHTPGHTAGSICLYGEVDGQELLFAGDTVGGSLPGLEGADLSSWARAERDWEGSLQRIAALDIDGVLNGHEPVGGLPISRVRLDRSIALFGKMLNPWFSLADDATEPAEGESAAVVKP